MTSLTEIYRIGRGPSSSHTMAPEKACRYMAEHFPQAEKYRVVLYGSLSKTGRGHGTDIVIRRTLAPAGCEIVFDDTTLELPHPNTMDITVFLDGEPVCVKRFISLGGGALKIEGEAEVEAREVYPETHFSEISQLCRSEGISLSDYVYRHEPGIKEHLCRVWEQMQDTVRAGLSASGTLPGGLSVKRRAADLYSHGLRDRDIVKKEHFLISAYAYAASEENAAGGMMVTAPTCGASGVMPAVLYYEKQLFGCSDGEIVDALATGGLVGQIIRTNASVSGAEAGCQAEVGSACSMAAAALASLRGFSIEQIECAAEIAMEHCLGLTCDPVGGLVQIPCIERNAVGALRSYDAAALSEVIYDNRKVSFDTVVETMYITGKDLSRCYRETSEGGLAKLYVNKPTY